MVQAPNGLGFCPNGPGTQIRLKTETQVPNLGKGKLSLRQKNFKNKCEGQLSIALGFRV